MFEWLEVQWKRFNLWLDYRRENPGAKVRVIHKGGDDFKVQVRKWTWGAAACEAERQKRLDEGQEKMRRANPFISKEDLSAWRANQERRHQENRALRQRGREGQQD